MKGKTLNLSTATVPELRAAAKAAGMKGYSTMKKADLLGTLLDYIQLMEKPEPKSARMPPVESTVEAIKASIRNAQEARSNKGRKAGNEAVKTAKQTLYRKVEAYRKQRNGGKMTPKQARRYVKAAAQGATSGA